MKLSDAEFDRQFKDAERRGDFYLQFQPLATAVRYQPRGRRVALELDNGSTFTFPAEAVQGVAGAPAAALASVRVLGPGTAIEWPSLDVQLSVAELLRGVFGTPAWMRKLAKNGSGGKLAAPPGKRRTQAIARRGH
jgi:hypothetical protein